MANIKKQLTYSVFTITDVLTGEVKKSEKRLGKVDPTKELVAYIKETKNSGVKCEVTEVIETRVMSLESFIANSVVKQPKA